MFFYIGWIFDGEQTVEIWQEIKWEWDGHKGPHPDSSQWWCIYVVGPLNPQATYLWGAVPWLTSLGAKLGMYIECTYCPINSLSCHILEEKERNHKRFTPLQRILAHYGHHLLWLSHNTSIIIFTHLSQPLAATSELQSTAIRRQSEFPMFGWINNETTFDEFAGSDLPRPPGMSIRAIRGILKFCSSQRWRVWKMRLFLLNGVWAVRRNGATHSNTLALAVNGHICEQWG